MPEGDTILWAATRMRPVLEGHVPDAIETPHPRHAKDRWPQRLDGRRIERIDTHGKNLFLVFEGDLLLHSHLRMTGMWDVRPTGERSRRPAHRAWLILRAGQHEVIQFDGPVLELMTAGRRRFDQRLSALGPDILAPIFENREFLRRLRSTDQTRAIGDALLDQRILAGIGNIWKAESCWESEIDPWRTVASLTDEQAAALVDQIRPRMLASATGGPRQQRTRIYRQVGRPCPRCGTTIRSHGQGDENRTTYWCPGCQH
jgi:endonuclease-8